MKELPKHEIPVIPTANLVDIAILLIIFYMACSNFVSQSALKLTPPKATDLEKMSEPLVLVTIDHKGVIRLQGKEAPNAAAVESDVASLVRNRKSEDERRVMFKCDASIRRDVFEPVLQAIVEAGGTVVAAGDRVDTPGAAAQR
jgi:biopolymer transport protein ExbD